MCARVCERTRASECVCVIIGDFLHNSFEFGPLSGRDEQFKPCETFLCLL